MAYLMVIHDVTALFPLITNETHALLSKQEGVAAVKLCF